MDNNICTSVMERMQLLKFELVLPSGLVLFLNNFHYAPSIVRGVVSFSCLLDLGFQHTINNKTFICLCIKARFPFNLFVL